MYIKEIFVRPTKIHAVYIWYGTNNTKNANGAESFCREYDARAVHIERKRESPSPETKGSWSGGGAPKNQKIKGRPVSVFFFNFVFFAPPAPPREPGTSKPSALSLEPGLWIGSLSLGNVYLFEALERPRNRITNKPGFKTKEEHTQKCASMSCTPIASAY